MSQPENATIQTVTEVWLDGETGGLRPGDTFWEVAAIRRTPDGTETAYVWHLLDFDAAQADPKALQLAGYYDRYPGALIADPADPLRPFDQIDRATHPALNITDLDGVPLDNRHKLTSSRVLALDLERLTRGAVVWGCNPTYDVSRLETLFTGQHRAWTAHYRPMCATAWGAATGRALGMDVGPFPLVNDKVADGLGIDRTTFGQVHSALADCYYAKALVDVSRALVPAGVR